MHLHDLDGRAFITVDEFAALSHSDPRTVRRGITAGEIPSIRFSKTIRIPVPKVREMLGLPAASQAATANAA